VTPRAAHSSLPPASGAEPTPTRPKLGPLAQYALLAGPLLSMLDSSIVNVAVEPIARELHAGLTTVQWTVSGYLLALGAGLAGTAYLARRFGTLPVYRVSVIAFTVTSALCALAPDARVLIAARVAQGLVAAPLVPLAMSMLLGGRGARSISPLAGLMLFLGPALGPTVGGALIGAAGWRSIFLVNVPVGALAALAVRSVPAALAPGRTPGARFDLPGLILLAGRACGRRCPVRLLHRLGAAPRPARRRQHPVQHLAADRRLLRHRPDRRPVHRSVPHARSGLRSAHSRAGPRRHRCGRSPRRGRPPRRPQHRAGPLAPPRQAALLGYVGGRVGDRPRVRAEVLQVLMHPQQVRVVRGDHDADQVLAVFTGPIGRACRAGSAQQGDPAVVVRPAAFRGRRCPPGR